MNSKEQEAAAFIEAHVAEVAPLFERSNLAAWEASVTGSEEALKESADARVAVKKIYSRPDELEKVVELQKSGQIKDALIARQLELLRLSYLTNQMPAETIADLTRREAELEGVFYNFRSRVDGREASNNLLRDMLCAEMDSERRRRIWEASKAIGREIAPRLRELARRRNAAARDLGFRDYYAMGLEAQEIDEAELFELLEEFRNQTEESFAMLRRGIDEKLAQRHGIDVSEVRSWHWDDFFSQDAPSVGDLDLDPLFRGMDLEAVARDYFAGIGLPVEDVMERSDLYEREGKDQHAFCTDIDRKGDVRILCNLKDDERWMKTLLHELGHAVYDKFLPLSIPYLLRTPAHTLSTESIAMHFGRLTRDAEWLNATIAGSIPDDQLSEVDQQQRMSMLVAARWMLVMVYFECALYEDPDRDDLNALWWDLVEEYQLIQRPDGRDEPDWATKIHFALAPVYYHNYLMGELMASQIRSAIDAAGAGDEPGAFLRSRIFERGAILPWNDLLEEATGERLSPRAFVNQFVAEPSAT